MLSISSENEESVPRSENIMVMTSNHLRHRYFFNHLNHRFPIAVHFRERFKAPTISFRSIYEENTWNWFFNRRREYEIKTFGSSDFLQAENNPRIIRLHDLQINSPAWMDQVKQFNPGLIVLFGTSLFCPEFINRYSGRIINLHIGLSEHYRGTNCNFWPIYENKLEYLGATIHHVDNGIDTGDIILQDTIRLEPDDNEQSLGGKTIILGTELMISAIKLWKSNSLPSRKRKSTGRNYPSKNFNAQSIAKVKEMMESNQLRKNIES
ncbi:MAG: formyl transferase, partial [Nitrospinales bacterium]